MKFNLNLHIAYVIGIAQGESGAFTPKGARINDFETLICPLTPTTPTIGFWASASISSDVPAMVQHIQIEEGGIKVQSLKEIKKSRRTVMLGSSALSLPDSGNDGMSPLTPPLSERASGDVEQLFSPEAEEHYENIDLSSDECEGEWDQSMHQRAPIDGHQQVWTCHTIH